MREYVLELGEVLQRGLRPDERVHTSQPSLTKCTGMKPHFTGLVRSTVPTCFDITLPAAASYPYPQLFLGKKWTILAYRDALYRVDSFSTVHAITLYDSITLAEGSITPTGLWHFADFGESFLLMNGSDVISFPRYDMMETISKNRFSSAADAVLDPYDLSAALITSSVSQTTCDYFRGRAIMGPSDNMGNEVQYSSVGGTDRYVDYLSEEYLLNELRGDKGSMYLPAFGNLLRVMGLGTDKVGLGAVIAYCQNGVYALVPVLEPMPTFGLHAIAGAENVGILDRDCVAGSDSQHVFISSEGELWRVTSQLTAELIGHKEQISPLVGNSPTMCFDTTEKEFHIHADNGDFVLTRYGLGEAIEKFSHCARYLGNLYAVWDACDPEAGVTVPSMDVRIGPINFGRSAFKTVYGVDIDSYGITSLKVAVDYTADESQTYTSGSLVSVDDSGHVYASTGGINFQIRITGTLSADAVISNIAVRWKGTDKRFLRSPTE